MPLDHFISQVHLKNFYSDTLGDKMMHAYRKSDLNSFPCKARDVCRIMDGNTNSYLDDERAIEEFLKIIEPKYNESVEKFRKNEIDIDAVYVLSGFIAYIGTCSPTAMRMNAALIEGVTTARAMLMDQHGEIPPLPSVLGDKSFSEMLSDGTVRMKVDAKYPQAIGISSILNMAVALGNSKWEVILNNDKSNPFFTSDFPIAVEETADQRIMSKLVPLAPDLAIRITADINHSKLNLSDNFEHFRTYRTVTTRQQVIQFNRLIVRAAEDVIFSSHNAGWVEKFVAKNRNFEVTTLTKKFPTENGYFIWSGERIINKNKMAIK